MAERWRAPGGWTVEVVRVTGTGGRDGEWLWVRQYGFWTADVRSAAELERWFPIAALEKDGLAAEARLVLAIRWVWQRSGQPVKQCLTNTPSRCPQSKRAKRMEHGVHARLRRVHRSIAALSHLWRSLPNAKYVLISWLLSLRQIIRTRGKRYEFPSRSQIVTRSHGGCRRRSPGRWVRRQHDEQRAAGARGAASRLAGKLVADADPVQGSRAAGADGSVHFTGTYRSGRGTNTYDQNASSDEGNQVITTSGGGKLTIRVVAGVGYLRGNATALSQLFPNEAVSRLVGRWIVTHPGDPGYQDFTDGVTLASVLADFTPTGSLTSTGPQTVDGQSVVA
jgi:hypothetical protein